jgi:hypothetical protein
MTMARLLALCLAAAAPSAASAEPTPPTLTLKEGTPVPLKTVAPLNSKTTHQGERFDLVVDEDVVVGGHVVIPRGAPATGEVVRHSAQGPYGKAGGLEVRLLYVSVGGRNIRLDGAEAKKGRSGEVPAVATALIWGGIGMFISGKSAAIPAGTPVTGYVHRDLPLVPSD